MYRPVYQNPLSMLETSATKTYHPFFHYITLRTTLKRVLSHTWESCSMVKGVFDHSLEQMTQFCSTITSFFCAFFTSFLSPLGT
jgi:hypothetical protein